MSAKLSVNINKYALLRNSRGHDAPNLLDVIDCVIAAGAHGITVHPRRDQRHVRFADVPVIAAHLRAHHRGVELNIECEAAPETVDLVLGAQPAQCTLVPVTPGELTSDHGYQKQDVAGLVPIVKRLREANIRVSLFVDCVPEHVRALVDTGADRIELYTGPFASAWGGHEQAQRTREVWESGAVAQEVGLGINAGHDLDRNNLAGIRDLPGLCEVSIGHAQICRALEIGTTESVRELLSALRSCAPA
jgi:pyridoxine 5-phosphate synthase